jgi:hypothetical protein
MRGFERPQLVLQRVVLRVGNFLRRVFVVERAVAFDLATQLSHAKFWRGE